VSRTPGSGWPLRRESEPSFLKTWPLPAKVFFLLLSLCDHHVRLSPASLQTQHRLLLPNSLTHAPSVSFPPRSGSEDGKHQPPPEKRPRVHADADLNQNASVFPSLIFCHSKRATLSPASASPSSVAYRSATIITFHSSSPMSPPPFPVLCFRPYA